MTARTPLVAIAGVINEIPAGDTVALTSASLTTPTFAAGIITLTEGAFLELPIGSADGKFSGLTTPGTAGATLAFGDLIMKDVTSSKWRLADISVAAAAVGDARGLIGMCVLAAAADGSATRILLHGRIRADARFPTLTVGGAAYASTSGAIVVAQPATADYVIRIVGFAHTSHEIFFAPSNDYISHV